MSTRAPIRFEHRAVSGRTRIEFPVLAYFDRATADGRLLRGPANGGRITIRSLPLPILRPTFGPEPFGLLSYVEVHDTHLSGGGWVAHSIGAVVPAVDLDSVECVDGGHRAQTDPLVMGAFTLVAVTLHAAQQAGGSAWPDMPEAIFTIPPDEEPTWH